VTLCLISIVYGAFLAIGQDDLLRLVGLTSLSHFGFIALGAFVFTQEGSSGSILYMVNHGIATAAMFLVVGYLIQRRGTASIRAIRGVEKGAPVLAGMLLVAGLATAGLPGLSQFVSEILVLIGAFDYHWWVGAVAVTAVVWAAIYVLWMYQRTMTGPPDPGPHGPTADLTRVEVAVLAPLVAALLFFGFVPGPLLHLANPVSSVLNPSLAVDSAGVAR
jgi:NADH-quinone oxidoreductase subunit M